MVIKIVCLTWCIVRYRKLCEFDIQFASEKKTKKKGLGGKGKTKTKKDKKPKSVASPVKETDVKSSDEEDKPEEVKIKDPVKIKKAGTNVIAMGLGTNHTP